MGVGDEQLIAADDSDPEGGGQAPDVRLVQSAETTRTFCRQTRCRSAATITAIAGESWRRLG